MDRFEITASNNKMLSLFFHDAKSPAPQKMTAAIYTCTASGCGETLLGNHSVGFNCPCCKGDMKAGATKDLVASDLANLKTVGTCAFCATTMVSASEATGKYRDGKLYCPVCTDVVTVKADESDENPEMADMAPDLSDEDEDGEMDPADLAEGEDESGEDGEGASEEDENEEDNENEEGESSEGGEAEDSAGAGEDGSDSNGESETDDNEVIDVGTDKDDLDEELEASLLAAVGDKEVDVNLVASPNRKKWYLFADDVPVAISEKSRVAEGIREHFENDKFATAYHAAAKEGANEDLLKEFGFEPIVQKVAVDEAVRQTVEAQVNERAKNYALNAQDHNERLNKCLGLAAMGLVKGTFNDKNPVQDALVPTLHRLNVGDAANIVASAFEKHSPALLKTLLLRANELMEKDDTTVVEISRLVEEQPLPSERVVKKGIPPAAMSVIDQERVERVSAPKENLELAASTDSKSGFDDLFQRRKARKSA